MSPASDHSGSNQAHQTPGQPLLTAMAALVWSVVFVGNWLVLGLLGYVGWRLLQPSSQSPQPSQTQMRR
ncbi:hypothetical protein [Leptolyngbya sp. FACHB-261]|uniref:hypothetical protein n=1 Tax=Leptolyngbya sp. FACHB-261 TaxID=2692806 RepID=UPI0016847B8B|nr:hypothetical protein [Leptolyngbya sp. FACHB-261]